MMKKVLLSLLLVLWSFSLLMPKAYAENTLRDLRNDLQNLRNQKAQQDAAKNKTQAEINAENNKIYNAHSEIDKAESDIANSKLEIEKTNNSIAKMKDETEKILVFYQIMNGDNAFFEYITSAGSVDDMMMRSEAVTQILEYNEDKLLSLEDLIKQNEQLQVDLAKKQKELEKNIVSYQQNLDSLNGDLSSIMEMAVDIDKQISTKLEQINFYEEAGCKEDEDLDACLNALGTGAWMLPIEKGYVSSTFGWRYLYGAGGKLVPDYHPAIDLAAARGTPIYSASNGVVVAVFNRYYCGGNMVYINSTVQGKKYTLVYAHMLTINVKLGQQVNQQTLIGTVGGGGETLASNGGWDQCSFGYHLHFGVSNGYYTTFNNLVANAIDPPFLPPYGTYFNSRYVKQ